MIMIFLTLRNPYRLSTWTMPVDVAIKLLNFLRELRDRHGFSLLRLLFRLEQKATPAGTDKSGVFHPPTKISAVLVRTGAGAKCVDLSGAE